MRLIKYEYSLIMTHWNAADISESFCKVHNLLSELLPDLSSAFCPLKVDSKF